jgi:hypothetical protein
MTYREVRVFEPLSRDLSSGPNSLTRVLGPRWYSLSSPADHAAPVEGRLSRSGPEVDRFLCSRPDCLSFDRPAPHPVG